jgi:hypothetical protein
MSYETEKYFKKDPEDNLGERIDFTIRDFERNMPTSVLPRQRRPIVETLAARTEQITGIDPLSKENKERLYLLGIGAAGLWCAGKPLLSNDDDKKY